MNVSLHQESIIYTLQVGDKKFSGMRVIGDLGQVKHLSNSEHQVFVFDGNGPFTRNFNGVLGVHRGLSIIAADAEFYKLVGITPPVDQTKTTSP